MTPRAILAGLVAIAALVLLALFAGRVHALTLTFYVCDGYTLSRRGDDVLLRCPGKPDPVFVFRDCRSPVVKREAGRITLTCA